MSRYTRVLHPEQICMLCGVSFVATSKIHKYCSGLCQERSSYSRRPKRVWGKGIYQERRILEEQGLKKCIECKAVLPMGEFWNQGTRRLSRCRICAAERQKKLRKPDTNVEEKRKRARRWRTRHPELFKERIKAWGTLHPENRKASARRRRAKKSENGAYVVTLEDLRKLWIRQEGVCYICGSPIVGERHLEHIIPVKRGGRHAIGNLAWAHPHCNLTKFYQFLVEVRHGRRMSSNSSSNA